MEFWLTISSYHGAVQYPIFHVLLLKNKVRDTTIVSSALLVVNEVGRIKVCLMAILVRKLMKKDNKVIVVGLIQWSNSFSKDTT